MTLPSARHGPSRAAAIHWTASAATAGQQNAATPVPQPAAPSRVLRHAELFSLAIAHVDCDAFFASVEKARHPELADAPLIVGGGTRGVVTTACYIARLSGVHSAMPMFKARKLCPDAVVIRPDMAAYAAAARRMRAMMRRLTPLMQPLSIDEAALDLSGTAGAARRPARRMLARFARAVEAEMGVTVSIGLAPTGCWPSSRPAATSRAASRCWARRRPPIAGGRAGGPPAGRGPVPGAPPGASWA